VAVNPASSNDAPTYPDPRTSLPPNQARQKISQGISAPGSVPPSPEAMSWDSKTAANYLPAATLRFGNALSSIPGAPAQASSPAPSNDPVAQEVNNIISRVQHEQFPESILQVLSDGCKGASSDKIKKLVLTDPRIQNILVNLVTTLTTTSPGESPKRAAENIFFRFKTVIVTIDYDRAVKRALLDQALESNNPLLGQAFNRPEFVDIVPASLEREEQSAFKDFLTNSADLKPETRLALLAQVIHYPGKLVIENLALLANQDWFRDFDLGCQQGLAKVVAFDTQYATGDRNVLDNTLAFFLKSHAFKVKVIFVNDPVHVGQTYSNRDGSFFLIKLSRDWITPGNGKLADERGISFATELGLPHEVNHAANERPGFMGEYRARYVAKKGRHASGFDQRAAFVSILTILNVEEGIREKFFDDPNAVRFVARLIGPQALGKEPEKATVVDILLFGLKFENDESLLSDTQPALPPEPEDAQDPNILDNHV
jgi:hypothetical protein